MVIENAKITNVSLTMADYCSLVFWITVEGAGWGCNIGGYKIASGMLGAKPEEFTAEHGSGLVAMMRIMDAVGVNKWEDLKGKYCRVKTDGWGGTVDEIGNIIKDKWFNIKDFFAEQKHQREEAEKAKTLKSQWLPIEGEGVYQCQHCAKLVDIPSQYCPDCGAIMYNFNNQEG
jgi:hypothetical protein